MWGIGLALIFTGASVIFAFLPSRAFYNDFGHAYLAGRLLREHANVYTTSLPAYAQQIGLPFEQLMAHTGNPPALVWLFQWLSYLPVPEAFLVWVLLEVLSLITTAILSWRLLRGRLSAESLVLAFGLLICSMPTFFHFWFSQVQFLLLALVMIAYALWRGGRTGPPVRSWYLPEFSSCIPWRFCRFHCWPLNRENGED